MTYVPSQALAFEQLDQGISVSLRSPKTCTPAVNVGAAVVAWDHLAVSLFNNTKLCLRTGPGLIDP